jgi:hypothetical protein
MVQIAGNPRSTKYVGSTSLLLKASHAIFPELITKITGFVIRRYLKNADSIISTNGNVFNPVDYGMSVYGGFGLPGKPGTYRKYIGAALLMGIAAGFYLISSKNKQASG